MIVLKAIVFLTCAIMLLLAAAMLFDKGLVMWGLWLIFLALCGVAFFIMDFAGWRRPWL